MEILAYSKNIRHVLKLFPLLPSLDYNVDVIICIIAITLDHEEEDFTFKVLEFSAAWIMKLCDFKKLVNLIFMNEKHITLYITLSFF